MAKTMYFKWVGIAATLFSPAGSRLSSVVCLFASGEFVQVARDCEEKGGYFVGSLRGEESPQEKCCGGIGPTCPKLKGSSSNHPLKKKVLRLMVQKSPTTAWDV